MSNRKKTTNSNTEGDAQLNNLTKVMGLSLEKTYEQAIKEGASPVSQHNPSNNAGNVDALPN